MLDRAFHSTIKCLSMVKVWDRHGISLYLVGCGRLFGNTLSTRRSRMMASEDSLDIDIDASLHTLGITTLAQ
jgi:hypothetical protein